MKITYGRPELSDFGSVVTTTLASTVGTTDGINLKQARSSNAGSVETASETADES
jgi:hypothetical protein